MQLSQKQMSGGAECAAATPPTLTCKLIRWFRGQAMSPRHCASDRHSGEGRPLCGWIVALPTPHKNAHESSSFSLIIDAVKRCRRLSVLERCSPLSRHADPDAAGNGHLLLWRAWLLLTCDGAGTVPVDDAIAVETSNVS